MRRPMLNNSNPGQTVYDPFLGSGTTLIAAETVGRVCLGIEIDPLFVDIAVRRWQAFTGQAAKLSTDGTTFDAAAKQRSTKPDSKKSRSPSSRGKPRTALKPAARTGRKAAISGA
jgi:DNA modification methylase